MVLCTLKNCGDVPCFQVAVLVGLTLILCCLLWSFQETRGNSSWGPQGLVCVRVETEFGGQQILARKKVHLFEQLSQELCICLVFEKNGNRGEHKRI